MVRLILTHSDGSSNEVFLTEEQTDRLVNLLIEMAVSVNVLRQ